MSNDRIPIYEKELEFWKIGDTIGKGGSGTVYKVLRTDPTGFVYERALKVIRLCPDGIRYHPDREKLLSDMRDSLFQEIRIMDSMGGAKNIVSYSSGHCCPVTRDGEIIGYDFLIMMDLLTSLDDLLVRGEFECSGVSVARLGVDIARALELCHSHDIIHRDIKESNVFVDKEGNYLLGDFGVSRIIDDFGSTDRTVGTSEYIAPEIYNGSDYGVASDVYSLGIMLYKLQNKYRIPFFSGGTGFDAVEQAAAVKRRLNGEKLPPPEAADGKLAAIILKACEYDPDQRYPDAESLRRALEEYLDGLTLAADDAMPCTAKLSSPADDIHQPEVRYAPENRPSMTHDLFEKLDVSSASQNESDDASGSEKHRIGDFAGKFFEKVIPTVKALAGNRAVVISCAALLLGAAVVLAVILLPFGKDDVSSPDLPPVSSSVAASDSETPSEPAQPDDAPFVYGNTQANLLNSGLLLHYGGYIYYNCSDGLNRMKTDGTAVQHIRDQQCFYLNACHERIYFTDELKGDNIFSMLPDGSDVRLEVDSQCFFVIIVNDHMVYHDDSADKVCVRDLLTGETYDVYRGNCNYLTVVNGNIYLLDREASGDEPYGNLYCISLEGELLDFMSGAFGSLAVADDYLYSRSGDNLIRIQHAVGADTNLDSIRLDNSVCYFFNSARGKVYYCNRSQENNIYRMDPDGSSNELFLSGDCYSLNILGDWILYRNADKGYEIYLSRLDGKINVSASEYKGKTSFLFEKTYDPLKIGSSGDVVVQVQQKLIELGLLEGEASGYYDQDTADAIYQYQCIIGIDPTGDAYSFTINCLLSDYSYPD